jgi:hypothetical protein
VKNITTIQETNEAAVAVQDDPTCEAALNEPLSEGAPAETAIVKAERRATVAQPLLADLPTYVKSCTEMDGEVLGEYIERNWNPVTGTALGLVYLVKEMKRKFNLLDRKKQVDGTYKKIRGFTSFDKWFTSLTGKSRRLAYYLLETEEKKNERNANRRANASKSTAQAGMDEETLLPNSAQSLPTSAAANSAVWTDSEYIEACVQFVKTTLKPLESDPQRFARIAAAVAAEIVGEKGNDLGNSPVEGEIELAVVRLGT